MSSVSKARVLCIDRDSLALRLRVAIVESAGFTAVGSTSVEAGLQLINEQALAAVVLDENAVENSNGATARVAHAFAGVPVLLLSSGIPPSYLKERKNGLLRFDKQDGPAAFVAALRDCVAERVRQSATRDE